ARASRSTSCVIGARRGRRPMPARRSPARRCGPDAAAGGGHRGAAGGELGRWRRAAEGAAGSRHGSRRWVQLERHAEPGRPDRRHR
nr:hypothetical protein [Tanacetum cinerariifolium]